MIEQCCFLDEGEGDWCLIACLASLSSLSFSKISSKDGSLVLKTFFHLSLGVKLVALVDTGIPEEYSEFVSDCLDSSFSDFHRRHRIQRHISEKIIPILKDRIIALKRFCTLQRAHRWRNVCLCIFLLFAYFWNEATICCSFTKTLRSHEL